MKKSFTTLLLISSLILISLNVQAHPMGSKALMNALNLSTEQQNAFKRLYEAGKPNKQIHHEMQTVMQEKKKRLLQDYSGEKAKALAEEIAQQARSRALKRFAHMHQVMQILNDEQKTTFLKLMDKKRKGKHSHRDHH